MGLDRRSKQPRVPVPRLRGAEVRVIAALSLAGVALLIAYAVTALARCARRQARPARCGDSQSPPCVPPAVVTAPPAVTASVECTAAAPSLPTSTPATDVVLLSQCVCGGRLHGSAMDVARVCLSCRRIVAVHGSRAALVPIESWRTYQRFTRFGAVYGGTC